MAGLVFGNLVYLHYDIFMKVINQISKYRGIQGIYGIVNINKGSGKCPYGRPYVGQTIAKPTAKKHKMGIGHRLCDHRCRLRKDQHRNPKLQNAWNKYGESSFMFLMIEEVQHIGDLTVREQFWIDEWDSYYNGYNARLIAESSKGHRRRTDLTDDIIKKWIELHTQEHGQFPTHKCGVVLYAPENEPITWSGVSACLNNGFRGQNPGQSLSGFIAEKFQVINKSNTKDYTETVILEWVERFYDENGHYPTKRYGGVNYGEKNGYCSTSWSAIDACLVKGYRGLSGGITLNVLICSKAKHPVRFRTWHK